jgi:uncharacterized protein YbbK (DUF523 family)
MPPILVSACLLGLLTRYDGTSKRNTRVLAYLEREGLVPVPICPEQLAGLPTPRSQTYFGAGDGMAVLDGTGSVVNSEGTEMNGSFLKGAVETMKVARLAGCRKALLKERSPSCGVHEIYLGNRLRPGMGVTAALLDRNGIQILSEEDLETSSS